MAAELVDQLRASLGSKYTIVRELGGGGMSRVFLATDIALNREVVIKVLLPELAAGVNAERFDREVQLSARLQHPHIVPVLTAGQLDGLPYYVMPYVKGESLRARLVGGPLPFSEVASIMSDVAKALAFAQSERVVHRDIKPDNILLSGGAATVADFGIAKALSSARQSEAGETLTSLGTSLGTPAYMAPEQVAGDPDVDHRADIYSLGCVAYEMITGSAPFAGKSPQQLLAAHVLETPTPIEQRREGVPPSLIALVNRCMAKEPSERPQSAIELVGQLDGSDTHRTVAAAVSVKATNAKSQRKKIAIVAAIAAVVAAISVPVYRSFTAPKVVNTSLTFAVAPFEILDQRLALWKEGIVDVLSRNLDGSGPLRAIAPGISIKKWEGHGDRTTATTFGKRVGAQLVMYGQLQSAGADRLEAKVWIVDTDKDAAPIEISLKDSTSRMDRVTDSLSIKVLAAIGRNHAIGSARIASLGTNSLSAIKAFLQGAQHMRRSQWDSAAISFKEAVAVDSSFGIAFMQLAQALGWRKGAGNVEVNEANRRAGLLVRPGLSVRDSLLLTAVGHYANASTGGIRNFKEARIAIDAARAATERDPNDAEAWYFLGDFHYHADLSITIAEARAYFDRAIAADSDYTQAYIHAIELAYRYGPDVGRKYADAYLKRDPQDFDGEGVRLAAMVTAPKADQKAVLKAASSSFSLEAMRKAYQSVSHLPDSAESAIQILRGMSAAPDSFARRAVSYALASQLAARGHISESWNIAIRNKRSEAGEIATLGLVPVDSALKIVRPWMNERSDAFLIPIPLLAMVSDTVTLEKAANAMEEVIKRTPTIPQRPAIEYVIATLHAYFALAKHDTVTATRLFSALPDSAVSAPIDELTRARLIAKQDPQRALSILERLRPTGLVYTARELERGRIAERIGDKQRAVDAFAYVAEAWRNTESPQLKESVKEANAALQRLDADAQIRNAISTGGVRK